MNPPNNENNKKNDEYKGITSLILDLETLSMKYRNLLVEYELAVSNYVNYLHEEAKTPCGSYVGNSTNINQTKNDNVSNLRNSFNDELSSLQECLEMKKQEFSKECSVKMELDESSQDKRKFKFFIIDNLFNNEVLNNIDKRFKALLQDLVTLKKESNNDSKNLTKDLQKCKENILMELKILLELIDLLNNKMNLMN
jgi:hypothetical protein